MRQPLGGPSLAAEERQAPRGAEVRRLPGRCSWDRRRASGGSSPSRRGERYVDFPKDAFWAARKRAKLNGGPHTLRHTCASHFLQNVADVVLLAQVLGHSHQRVTEL